MFQMAFLRLQQDIQTRREVEVKCERSPQPFWMALGHSAGGPGQCTG